MSNKPTKRPLTQAEIRKHKQTTKTNVKYVKIVNRSTSQTIPIQLKAPPGQDFFVGEVSVPLHPKRIAKFPEHRLYSGQISNLQKQGRIQVLDSA